MDDNRQKDEEKRNEPRTPTLGVKAFFLPLTGEPDPLFEGMVYNLSGKGAGVISVNPVEVGDTVRISCSAIGSTPRDATVQWCDNINDNLYKFGLDLG